MVKNELIPQMHSIKMVNVGSVKEFDWVTIHIGLCHVKMNMIKTFFAVNWEVFLSSFAKEMGFPSDSALSYVKATATITIWWQCWTSRNGKTGVSCLYHMSMTAWPMVWKSRPVNDYLYEWMPNVKCSNYTYLFKPTWHFFGSVKVYHISIWQKNSAYVNSGQTRFALCLVWAYLLPSINFLSPKAGNFKTQPL